MGNESVYFLPGALHVSGSETSLLPLPTVPRSWCSALRYLSKNIIKLNSLEGHAIVKGVQIITASRLLKK